MCALRLDAVHRKGFKRKIPRSWSQKGGKKWGGVSKTTSKTLLIAFLGRLLACFARLFLFPKLPNRLCIKYCLLVHVYLYPIHFTDTRIARLVPWFEPRGWPSKIVNCLPNAKLYRGLVLPWCYLPGERARRNLELVVLERQKDRETDREIDRERQRERETQTDRQRERDTDRQTERECGH